MQLPHARKPTAAVRRDPAVAVHSRLSSFFHGTSVLGSRPTRPLRGCKIPHLRLRDIDTRPLNTFHVNASARMIRSRSSTRSLVDPASSLVGNASPLIPETFERYSRSVAHMDLEEQRLTRLRRAHVLSRLNGRKRNPKCFPNVADAAIRRKIFSFLASSIILVFVLTTCALRFKFRRQVC